VDFAGIVVGSAAAETGSSTFIINNVGLSPMTILGLAYTNGSITSNNSVFYNVTSDALGVNGYFTSMDMPAVGTVIGGGESVTVSVNFKANVSAETQYSRSSTD
jgi:hypothetical protein